MEQHDFKAFAEIVRSTFAMNPKWSIPSARGLEMWWRCLRGFSIEQVAVGFQRHLCDASRGSFQPMPADIIRNIEGNREDRGAAADLAWRRMLENLNTYDSAVFDDPAIHYAVNVVFGSWERVGLMAEDELPFRRMDFIRAYLAFKPGLPYPGRLVGRMERESAAGETRFTIARIGDQSKCAAVELGGQSGAGLVGAGEALNMATNTPAGLAAISGLKQ